jgi:putative cell wall-binding protein
LASPALGGLYVFGDFCSGRIWSVAAGGPATQAPTPMLDTALNIASFGEDVAGELYVVSLGGSIHRLVASGSVSRIAGVDRYATAAAVSAATFAPGVRAVLVATGENYPDALAAGGAAHAWGAPVLLVRHGSIPGAVAAELDRLDPERILVLGGPSVVSDAVAAALGAFATAGVTRLAGADRYATAAAVSAATFSPGVPVTYVATGRNYPDALTGASAAAVEHGPVLLVPGTFIPPSVAAELDRLNPGRIVVLGGPAVVSDGVVAVLGAYATAGVSRIAGADRYATAAAISVSVFAAGVPVAYVATGENYPDALAAGPAAAREIGPVLLVRQGSIPGPVAAELDRLNPGQIVVLGGPAVVSDAVAAALNGYLGP